MSSRETLKCDLALELRSVQLLGHVSRKRRNVLFSRNKNADDQIYTLTFSVEKMNTKAFETNMLLRHNSLSLKTTDIQQQNFHLLGAINSCVFDDMLYRCSHIIRAPRGEKVFRRHKKLSNLQNMLRSMSSLTIMKTAVV